MSGGGGSTTTMPDATTQGRQQSVWDAATAAASHSQAPGVNGLTTQAEQNYGNIAAQGNLGMSALGGNASAIQQLMNPYLQQVIGGINNQWGRLSGQVQNNINDQATRGGAFGGSRYGLAMGQGMADLANNQAQQVGNALYSGYTGAVQQAGQLANLGMGANQQLASLGDYNRTVQQQQDPYLRRLQILQSGLSGLQAGQTTTQQGGHNGLLGAIGGAATGFLTGGPLGAAIGGIGGLFG